MTGWLLDRPRLAAVILAALILLPLAALPRLKLDNSPETYFPVDAPAVLFTRQLRQQFPEDQVLVALFSGDGLWETATLRKLATLRFNFRGVGQSRGNFGNGVGEKEDVKAAVSFGSARPDVNEEKIGLCGYSFGGLVALSAAVEDSRVKAVAGISPLIQPENLLDNYARPKLLVCGDQDEFIEVNFLKRVTARIPKPKELAVFPGVDHFWTTEGDAMAEKVTRFFKEYL